MERLRAVLRPGAVSGRSRAAISLLSPAFVTLVTVALVAVTLWSSMTFGQFVPRFKETDILKGPLPALRRARVIAGDLSAVSLDWWAPPDSVGLQALTRYVRECTAEEDRLMLTWLEPRPYYFSGRLFAGGMFVFHTGWLSFPGDQRLTVDRLRSQSVPIVIADVGSFDLFARDYAIVNRYLAVYRTRYLAERYVLLAESTFGDDASVFRVLVDSTRAPQRVYEPLSLPCYT